MFELTDRGNKITVNSAWVNLHGCDGQEAANQWKTLVNKPIQGLNQGHFKHHNQDHLWKTNIWQWQAKNIPKMALIK